MCSKRLQKLQFNIKKWNDIINLYIENKNSKIVGGPVLSVKSINHIKKWKPPGASPLGKNINTCKNSDNNYEKIDFLLSI